MGPGRPSGRGQNPLLPDGALATASQGPSLVGVTPAALEFHQETFGGWLRVLGMLVPLLRGRGCLAGRALGQGCGRALVGDPGDSSG